MAPKKSKKTAEPKDDKEKIKERFRQSDADHDGFLNYDELKGFLQKGKKKCTDQQVRTLYQQLDKDGDGRLNFDEFVDYIFGDSGKEGPAEKKPDLNATAPAAIGRSPRAPAGSLNTTGAGLDTTAQTIDLSATTPVTMPASPVSPTSFASPTAVSEIAEDEAANQAATKIQSLMRGKSARKETENKQAATTKKERRVTLADLWDTMTLEGGQIRTTVPVGEIILLYMDLRKSGLDASLPRSMPPQYMKFEDRVEPEDLTIAEVAHLCDLLLANANLTEEEARASLTSKRPFPEDEDQDDRKLYGQKDGAFNLKRLKNLVSLISKILRVDEEYVTFQMVYVMWNYFEMTDASAALIVERGMNAQKSAAGADLFGEDDQPNFGAVNNKIELRDFQQFVYNGGILDDKGKKGVMQGEIALIFQRAIKKLPERLKERADKRKTKPKKVPDEKKSLKGRLEFECLMEEVHELPALTKTYNTPLKLIIHVQDHLMNVDASQALGKTRPRART